MKNFAPISDIGVALRKQIILVQMKTILRFGQEDASQSTAVLYNSQIIPSPPVNLTKFQFHSSRCWQQIRCFVSVQLLTWAAVDAPQPSPAQPICFAVVLLLSFQR